MSVYQQPFITIENFDNKNPNHRINSPRSLEACGRLGLDPKQLYYLDFNQYKIANPEVFALPKDIQKIRWDHSNKLREKSIESIIIERKKIIEYEYHGMKDKKEFQDYNTYTIATQPSLNLSQSNLNFRSQSQFNKKLSILGKNLSASANIKSTAIDRELKFLEKMKERQKFEIQSYVENELRQQFLRKENEEKLILLKQREEEYKRDISRKNRLMEMERKRREAFKEREFLNDLEEKNRQLDEKEFEQQRKLYEQQIEENIKKRELLRREEDNKRKQEEYRLNNEKIVLEERLRADDKKRKLEEKEQERRIYMEQKRLNKIRENEKNRLMHQKRIDQTRTKLEEKLRREADLMLKKQIMSEEKRQQFDDLRKLAMKKKDEEALKKQEEMQKHLDKCREIEDQKIYEFHRKMDEMEKQKKIIEKAKEEELVRKQIEIKNRELKLIQAREEKEKKDNFKKEIVVAKIQETDNKIKNMKEAKETEMMQKNETNILRRTEKDMNIKRIENMKEYERQKFAEKLEQNYRKAEEFKDQKLIIGEKKKEINMEIALQKKLMVNKLEEYVAKNKEITPEAIKSLFPGDDALYEKAIAMKEQMSSKSQFRSSTRQKESVEKRNTTQDNFNLKTEGGRTKINFRDSKENQNYIQYESDEKKNKQNTNHIIQSTNKIENYLKTKSNFLIENEEIAANNSDNPNVDFLKMSEKKNFSALDKLSNMLSESVNDAINEDIKKFKGKLNEKEVDRLIYDYRTKLNSELLKILTEEKYKEEEREVLYNQTVDVVEKKRLEKIISMERAQSSEKILKINDDIDKKLKSYEIKLKSYVSGEA